MQIKIEGIVCKTIIGCYEYERDVFQDLIIDIIARLNEHDWVIQDQLTETVNYDELIEFVKSIVAETQYKLLESLAQFIANKLLTKYEIIKNIEINIVKPAICGVKAREIKVSYFSKRQFKVALALGSNLNLPYQQLIFAIELLNECITKIKIGGFYETKPYGNTQQNNFYNTAIIGYTTLTPQELLAKIITIEKLMGKNKSIENGARVIDIDIIFYENVNYVEQFLKIPHIGAHLRDFVLQPLIDIEPNLIHPVLNMSISQLIEKISSTDRFIIRQAVYSNNINS